MQELPDSDLVVRSKGGSVDAFAELFRRYKAKILNYIYGYIGNFADAQELAQEAFINAFTRLGSLLDETKFSSWLYAIATNQSRNYITKKRRRKEEPLEQPLEDDGQIFLKDAVPSPDQRPDESMDRKILQDDIQRALNGLSAEHREVLLLCDIEGLSYEEAAAALGCKVGTIGSRLSQARNKFLALFNAIRRLTP